MLNPNDDRHDIYNDFWAWFTTHERPFFNTVQSKTNLETDFFQKLSLKLAEIQDGFLYLTGMWNDDTAELVFTADGVVKNIVFVEDLVQAAPQIPGWKFTALKPPMDIEYLKIGMAGCVFDRDRLSFYATNNQAFPDEIDLTLVHRDMTDQNRLSITNGTYLFLENYLGELNFVTAIDRVSVIGPQEATQDLIPIDKLNDFLRWREKEFQSKYDATVPPAGDSAFSLLEANLNNGHKLIAAINTGLLKWDCKASHPWLLTIVIPFDGKATLGLPDDRTFDLLDTFEATVLDALPHAEGYLHIGRQTGDNTREIYLACKDFRKPSKLLHHMINCYPDLSVTYDIFKDKYWQSLNHFHRINPL